MAENREAAQAPGIKLATCLAAYACWESVARDKTTPEHERMGKILRGSVIEKIENRGASDVRLANLKTCSPRASIS